MHCLAALTNRSKDFIVADRPLASPTMREAADVDNHRPKNNAGILASLINAF